MFAFFDRTDPGKPHPASKEALAERRAQSKYEFRSGDKSRPLLHSTIDEEFKNAVRKFGNRPAVSYGSNTWTYEELDRHIEATVQQFRARGLGRGMVVGMIMHNRPAMIIEGMAVLRIGAVIAPFDPSILPGEFNELLMLVHPHFLITENGDLNKIDVRVDEEPDCGKVYPEMPAFIQFPDGSDNQTRVQKDTNEKRVNCAVQLAEDLELTPDDRVCITGHLYRGIGIALDVMATFYAGGCAVLPTGQDPESVLSTIERRECTVLNGRDATYQELAEVDSVDKFNLSSLTRGYLARKTMSEETFRNLEERLGFTMTTGFRMRELAGPITSASWKDPFEQRFGTVQQLSPHVDARIAEDGELCVRGYIVIQSYMENVQGVKHILDAEDWFHTGIRAEFTEDGLVRYLGNMDD